MILKNWKPPPYLPSREEETETAQCEALLMNNL